MWRALVLGVFFFGLMNSDVLSAEQKGRYTVQDMIGHCANNEKSAAGNVFQGYCFGMSTGVLAVLIVNSADNSVNKACVKSFTSAEQVAQIFLNWADKNPKHWQVDAWLGFMAAITDAYPCPK